MNDPGYNDIFSVEEANRMTMRGVPFREAYRAVASRAGSGDFKKTSPADYTHIGSIGNTGTNLIRLRIEKIMEGFTPGSSPGELFNQIKGRM
ncbi:MAG: hypothetical protein MZV63_24525 [Marinilabiliales bacterium]|nr:hypothetical protein [Marinilabiliales bacterium]